MSRSISTPSRAKEERIERFKTGYAVVRNSTRFLPLAAANVTRQAEESGDTSLTRSISTFMQDVNLFLTTPADDDGRERLGADMKKLRDDSVSYPPPLANALANLLAHAEVLLARRGPTEFLFQEATSNEISDLANQLAGSLNFELARQESVAANYERGVLAVIAVLALFWIVLAVQQRARGDARAEAPEALSEIAVEMAREPVVGSYEQLHAMALQDEFDNLPPGAIDRELAAVSASRAGLSAESAMLYKFRSERVGDSVAGAAERLATRMDHLRETHQRIHTALQGTDGMLELPDSIDLDEEIEASLAIANHARREVNGIADLARRLSSHADLPNGDVERDMVDVNACIDEVVEATRADAVATISKRLRDVPEIFASRTEIRLLLAQVLENSVRAVERSGGAQGHHQDRHRATGRGYPHHRHRQRRWNHPGPAPADLQTVLHLARRGDGSRPHPGRPSREEIRGWHQGQFTAGTGHRDPDHAPHRHPRPLRRRT